MASPASSASVCHHADLHDLGAGAARVEPGDRGRHQRAVGGHVEIECDLAVVETRGPLPFLVGIGDAHQDDVAVVRAQTPERPVRPVESEVPDALFLEQRPRLAGLQVVGHQVAIAHVVRRIEQRCQLRGRARARRPGTASLRRFPAAPSPTRPPARSKPGAARAPGSERRRRASARLRSGRRATAPRAPCGRRLRWGVTGCSRTAARFFAWNSRSKAIQFCQAWSSGRPNTRWKSSE